MAHTSRLLLVASVCALAVLYGGSALALPHPLDYKTGKGDSNEAWYGNGDRDTDNWGDEKREKYKKYSWGEHEPKKDRFTWGYGKEEEWQHGYAWKDWGKDPNCEPSMTPTPEPGTLLLLGSSLSAAGIAWRRRQGAREAALELLE
jgi:hypothetical protein